MTSTIHDRRKQNDEPIKIPRNYEEYNSLKAREKPRAQLAVGFASKLVENLARDFSANH